MLVRIACTALKLLAKGELQVESEPTQICQSMQQVNRPSVAL